ncbi:hypothetical protein [Pseudoalteromonas gelatinilytica]|uniref:Orphan protein n=1 Tax=Pseudoalteromonas gelatinilytica TaxID=1703256 RepID=A0ABQ1TCN2_9GAMM|nr:hypothetical protein [Pseudoalteromonas profundi]GGE88863.1 hypothetical protein GCM10008027_12180 [Pseudoalteromonas profundi]
MELSKLFFGLAVTASFICGAVAMSLFQSTPQQQPQTYQQEFVELQTVEVPDQQATPVINKQVVEINSDSSAAVSKSELEQQVAELKLQIENQQAVIASYRSSAIPPQQIDSHLDELYTLLEEQSRDEAWAYQMETAMSDFLIMADLPVQPQLSVSSCKSSVCQFKLLQPEGSDDLPSHYWRNMTDKMMEQSWWKQFKFTSTTSSDDSLTIIASTQ